MEVKHAGYTGSLSSPKQAQSYGLVMVYDTTEKSSPLKFSLRFQVRKEVL